MKSPLDTQWAGHQRPGKSNLLKSNPLKSNLRAARQFVIWAMSGCLGVLLSGCADLPRDQHGLTEQIQQKGVLTVGVSRQGEELSSLEEQEKRLIEKVAQRLKVRVAWQPGNTHEMLQELEEAKLPLVAATIPSDTPFAERIGLSQPYKKDGPGHKDYCLAVAPGENRLLLLVDQVIAEEQSQSGKS